jgi:hypothetical protein
MVFLLEAIEEDEVVSEAVHFGERVTHGVS